MQTKNDNNIRRSQNSYKNLKRKANKMESEAIQCRFYHLHFLYLFIHFYYEKNFKMYTLVYMVQFLDKSCE